jgi:hypothetical protein
MSKDISATLHAAVILLALPSGEYAPALANMVGYMRQYSADPELPPEQVKAAKATLRKLEQRLG